MSWSRGSPQLARRPSVPPRPGAKLAVFLHGRRAGTLERRGPSRYRFAYSSGLLAAGEGAERMRLSASLPLREKTFTPSESAPFFEGLLPEGTVRKAVAEKLRLSEEDGFGMLAALGVDCAGAVVVVPDGPLPDARAGGTSQPLSEAELEGMLRDLPRDPLGIEAEPDGVRLSLGGVQDKLVLVRDLSGRFAKPRGGTPSTCLLKPEHDRYEGLAVNEAFCMRVAARAGCDVARTELLAVGRVRCLYVERFDRVRDAPVAVVRLHQEDMCQALGILPSAKYEANGGPSATQIIALLRRLGSRRAAVDVNAFVKAMLVSFLLGNSDAHAKNFALLYESTGVRLAPLYDIVATAVYPSLTPRMAMAIGGDEDPAAVDLSSWKRFGEAGGLGGQLPSLIRRWSADVLAAAAECRREASEEGWHHQVIDAIVDVCRERAGRLVEG